VADTIWYDKSVSKRYIAIFDISKHHHRQWRENTVTVAARLHYFGS